MIGTVIPVEEQEADSEKRLSMVDEALVAGTIANTNGLLVILAKLVAAGSWDGLVRVWETETGRPLATLIAPASPDPATPQWMAITPEGYYHASGELAALARWRTGGQAVSGDVLRATLEHAEMVQKALRAEAVDAPKFIVAEPARRGE